MFEFVSFFEIVQGAGDVAIFAVVYFLWKLDRRLVKLETRIGLGQ
jgi:hypothetical protein